MNFKVLKKFYFFLLLTFSFSLFADYLDYHTDYTQSRTCEDHHQFEIIEKSNQLTESDLEYHQDCLSCKILSSSNGYKNKKYFQKRLSLKHLIVRTPIPLFTKSFNPHHSIHQIRNNSPPFFYFS